MPSSSDFTPGIKITPPQPGQHILSWAMENPDAIHQLIDMHNKMQNLQISVVQDGETKSFPVMMTSRGGNAIIELRL